MPRGPGPYPPGAPEGGGEGLPPSRLAGPRRHSLTNVLIVGGTPALREEVARAFHRESPLAGGPFVRVNCATDEESLRAALQAWAAAAAFEPAQYPGVERGTLYLDPVERLSPDTQFLLLGLARRLRGEAAGAGERAGAGRLVAGNSRDLAVAVSEGVFLPALPDALDKVRVQLAPGPREAAG